MTNPRAAIQWTGITQAVALVVLTCLCYWPSLNGGFLWDDDLWLTHSPLARTPGGLRQIWFSTVPYDYFPLTYTTFWLEWRLWGADPLGYRVVSLALHLASAGLLWRLLTVLRVPGAWFGALLWAIHPVNVASVAWIAELKNTLSMVFYLGSLICFVQAGRRWYGAALGLFVLAVLSKTSVVMLPCVLLLIAWWQRGRISRVDWVRSAPFFVVSLAAGLTTVWFQHHRSMNSHDWGAHDPLALRMLLVPRVLLFYLGKAFFPVDLSMIYPRWDRSLAASVTGLATLACIFWIVCAKGGRGLLTALGSFLITVLPVAGLVPMTFFMYSFVSDHLVYLPLVGLLAAAAAMLATLRATPRWRHVATGAMLLLSGSFAVGCFIRAGDFGSSERLWTSTLTINPRCAAAHNNLGLALEDKKRWSEAEAHFRAALRLDPHLSAALSNEAALFQHEGRWQEAAGAYEAALAQLPDPKDCNNYGVVCLHLDDTTRARALFQRAAAMEPAMLSPHINLYKIALAQNDPAVAATEWDECVRRDPGDASSLLALLSRTSRNDTGRAMSNQGREERPRSSETTRCVRERHPKPRAHPAGLPISTRHRVSHGRSRDAPPYLDLDAGLTRPPGNAPHDGRRPDGSERRAGFRFTPACTLKDAAQNIPEMKIRLVAPQLAQRDVHDVRQRVPIEHVRNRVAHV